MENENIKRAAQDVQVQEKRFVFFRVLASFWLVILLATVIGGVGGYFYGKWRVKPTYTASGDVMLVVSLKNTTLYNELSLSKMYIPKISKVVTSESITTKANAIYTEENYGEVYGQISNSSISTSYGEDSLIFNISYRDTSEKAALDKYDALLKSIKKELNENVYDYVNADSINLVDTQYQTVVIKSYSIKRQVAFGAVIFGTLSILVVSLIYLFDNKIKDGKELETITGVNMLSYIDKV